MAIYDEDYEGPRWIYALINRPAWSACPAGRIVGADKSHCDWPHGTIEYARQLTADEIYRYELIQLHPLPEGFVRIKITGSYFEGRSEYLVENKKSAVYQFLSGLRPDEAVDVLEGDAAVVMYVVEQVRRRQR